MRPCLKRECHDGSGVSRESGLHPSYRTDRRAGLGKGRARRAGGSVPGEDPDAVASPRDSGKRDAFPSENLASLPHVLVHALHERLDARERSHAAQAPDEAQLDGSAVEIA